MFSRQRFATIAITCLPAVAHATGLNFWESSTSNSALAGANGAHAVDASVLATAPSSMTQLSRTTITANVTQYQVDTDYYILGTQSQYSKANPIPAGFFVTPMTDNWYFGLSAYSRTAADITIPVLIPVVTNETRMRPIVVSFAPSVAVKINDVSVGFTVEYQYASYLLEKNACFINCTMSKEEGTTGGWSGAISATWQVDDYLSLAASHKLDSDFGNDDIQFNLPSITSLYSTFALTDNWRWHNTYSLSRWHNQGITYIHYLDPVGLLKGSRHSQRYATSMTYDWRDFTFRGGVSLDKAIDAYGGEDIRYRLGMSYRVSEHLTLDLTGFIEDYAHKQYTSGSFTLVDVQNDGSGLSLGASYHF
ncbi:Outer membrane protein transport protein (OMPP1/FadL/TodX) [Vibrio thalassae]|uniref:Outer membrane protein transport protein (OMPP1/FadL/TodX) n=1 Tax=Vibrio thalassae TaxID=1243014 RepID=A0A240EHH5_9VIBR|nr:outer membrane protein transport protein [Vibrio thalassae]SNX48124.1 Outer membrane protein transport protein (OMPP1/FadL/TodX) [Vibrio thalassae]